MKTPSTKAGSSRSRSKTTRTSKNTSEKTPQSTPEATADQIKADLLSLISHELRTPLSSVLNAVRILKDEPGLEGSERAKFLDMALRNAERLNATLNELLDLSKLVSGRLICRFHEVPLGSVLQGELARVPRVAVSPTMAARIDGLPVLLADAGRLAQVFSGVLDNAARFSPPASEIGFSVKAGVPAAELPQAFAGLRGERHSFVLIEVENVVSRSMAEVRTSGALGIDIFGQKEAVLDRAHEGVGGSLAIATEVMAQHSGALAAETTDGRVTVRLALPILEHEYALRKVLESRLFALKTEVGALSLVILRLGPKAPKDAIAVIDRGLKEALFRATDTVYRLSDTHEVAVLVDDCKPADAPKIVARLLGALGSAAKSALGSARIGFASCPDDATEPDALVELARKRQAPIPS